MGAKWLEFSSSVYRPWVRTGSTASINSSCFEEKWRNRVTSAIAACWAISAVVAPLNPLRINTCRAAARICSRRSPRGKRDKPHLLHIVSKHLHSKYTSPFLDNCQLCFGDGSQNTP